MAHPTNKYTVLIGFPTGGGHYSKAGQVLDLLEVQAHALVAAGRLKLTSEVEAEATAVAASKKATASTKEVK